MPLIPEGHERRRINRIMEAAISDFKLDLRGIGVLTEAASGYFATTPLLAALAGADPIFAVGRDSRYGSYEEIAREIEVWAEELKVGGRIIFQQGRPSLNQAKIDLVTNLGFVRPIDRSLLELLTSSAVVSLMWEPWEFRAEDIDIASCEHLGIPVLGTCETHPRLRTYDYLAFVAARLMLERGVEVFRSRIVIIGSDPFGSSIQKGLLEMSASEVALIRPDDGHVAELYARRASPADAVVIAEHRASEMVVGGARGIDPRELVRDGTVLVHICGNVDIESIRAFGLPIHPDPPAPYGKMTVTTDYAGPTPVIDLHAAGLKVGEIGVRNRRHGREAAESNVGAAASDLAIPVHFRTPAS
ncbi:hypothetical protein [Bradyrhizobium sp. McL0615]|uniref:hypothetical protein n=1 Tax=Bradyrhizobium sp. McL0615 TaxID=3415673 RepID=UPI003CFB0A13